MNQTNKNDAPLYIDVYCYKCKKRMALSNAIQHGDGRVYCLKCSTEHLDEYVEIYINRNEHNGTR